MRLFDFSELCSSSEANSQRIPRSTTTTLSLSLLPLPILLLTHFLSPSRVPLSTYAPTLPLLIGYALYLHSLPTPPTSFDREDRSIATGLLIAATILTPLLFHAVALDFPSQFDTRVVENWPWAGARGERWDPLDKRSSSLVDLAFFGSLLLAAWALFGASSVLRRLSLARAVANLGLGVCVNSDVRLVIFHSGSRTIP